MDGWRNVYGHCEPGTVSFCTRAFQKHNAQNLSPKMCSISIQWSIAIEFLLLLDPKALWQFKLLGGWVWIMNAWEKLNAICHADATILGEKTLKTFFPLIAYFASHHRLIHHFVILEIYKYILYLFLGHSCNNITWKMTLYLSFYVIKAKNIKYIEHQYRY